MDNDFILFDRIEKIKSVLKQYGEDNFYMSFSGGKDSCVLSYLLDMSIPDNKIPRVYSNTGIELNIIYNFVLELQKTDDRIIIIKPSQNIKEMLESKGYPFKSKRHSALVEIYQKYKTFENRPGLQHYLNISTDGKKWSSQKTCPKILEYQFTNDFHLKVSDRCCVELKEKPLDRWGKENNKKYAIIGLMREEGGRRENAQCIAFKNKKFYAFQPLAPISKEWENWFIDKYNVKICDIYKPPYNFERTGCKGCPFNQHIQRELDTMEKYFPNEKKQCEYIWEPVYTEYRRIGYRLNGGK